MKGSWFQRFTRLVSPGDARLVWLRVRAPSCTAAEDWRGTVLEHPAIRKLRPSFREVDVSRDERPEVDSAAQSVLQSLGERSGWPLSLFLDPADGSPVFGCGALESEGLEAVLRHLLVAWETSRADLSSRAREAGSAARARDPQTPRPPAAGEAKLAETLSGSTLSRFLTPLHQSLDPSSGAIGDTQDSFLYPQAYACLVRRSETLRVGQAALERLARSPACDVLGGGFFRSTDGSKLLVENAEMLEALELGARITRSSFLQLAASEARAGLVRDFYLGGGDFAAGLGESAAFYEFSAVDFLGALDGPERLPAQRFFGLGGVGFGSGTGRRPSLVTDVATLAGELNLPPVDLQNQLAAIRRKLVVFREGRASSRPRRSPPAELATAAAIHALLSGGGLEDGGLEIELLAKLRALVDARAPSAPLLAGRAFSAGDRLRWQLARACLAAASVKRPLSDQVAHSAEWLARADRLLGDVDDALDGVRGDSIFLGERSDLADFTGRSSAALRFEAWLDRFERARRDKDELRAARIEAALPEQFASALEAARELGLHAAGLYAAFVRAGACGLFQSLTRPVVQA
jgi:hypothetical protein